MNHEGLGKLMDRWTNDPQFRTEVRADPMGAIQRSGVKLSDEERSAVASIDWTLSDAELATRTSFAV